MTPSANVDLEALAVQPIRRSALVADEMARAVAVLGPRWSVADPDLQLALAGPMTRTGAVAAYAGALADELDHHPRIVIEYAGLTLTIHTHTARALTALDLVYAARLEQWLRANGWA
jgi:pterin-4a-carbinolamine dehydratase